MTGSMVTFPANGTTTSGYLATPQSGAGPGVLVIQEWWGLVPHIKHVCDRFAAEGFVALAPDMFHGQTASEPDGAGKLFMALNIARAEKDLRGAVAYLLARSSTKRSRGGGLLHGRPARALRGDAQSRGGRVRELLRHPPEREARLREAGRPGPRALRERDGFVTPTVARQVDADIRAAGKSSEIHIYPNVDHAFFNDERPDVYDRAAAEDAWRRTLTFFRHHLK
jgi:carboxymethylenebutenolidase